MICYALPTLTSTKIRNKQRVSADVKTINGATTITSTVYSGNRDLIIYAPVDNAELTIDESEKAIVHVIVVNLLESHNLDHY